MIGIYTLEIDRYIYIGSSNNIPIRKKQHLKQLVNNSHHNKYLQQVVNKYGLDNLKHKVLITYDYKPKEQLLDIEQQYINSFKSDSQYVVVNIRDTDYVPFIKLREYSTEDIYWLIHNSYVDYFTGDLVNIDYDGNFIDAYSGDIIERGRKRAIPRDENCWKNYIESKQQKILT